MRIVCWQTILMKYNTLFCFKKMGKILQNLSSASVVIGALRLNSFQGGTIGFTTSLAFLLWISLGGIITKTSVVIRPELSTEGCNWNISGLASPSTSPVNTVTPQTIEATTSVYDKYS